MSTTLGDGVTVEISPPEQIPVAYIQAPTSTTLLVPVAGPPGAPGSAAGMFEYVMPVAQTTALVDHPIGHDPVSVQVVVDSAMCSEFLVVFTIPGEQVRVSFDVAVQATIRLM